MSEGVGGMIGTVNWHSTLRLFGYSAHAEMQPTIRGAGDSAELITLAAVTLVAVECGHINNLKTLVYDEDAP